MRKGTLAAAVVFASLVGCADDDAAQPSESDRWTLTGDLEDADAAEYCVRYSGVTEAKSTTGSERVTVVVIGDREAADAFAACAERRGADLTLGDP